MEFIYLRCARINNLAADVVKLQKKIFTSKLQHVLLPNLLVAIFTGAIQAVASFNLRNLSQGWQPTKWVRC